MDRRIDTSLCTWPQVDASDWARTPVPFPVAVPYRPRPDLARLGALAGGRAERAVLDAGRDAPALLRDKWLRIECWPERCVAIGSTLAGDPAAVWARVCAAANAIVDAIEAIEARGAAGATEATGEAGETPAAAARPPAGTSTTRTLTRHGGRLHAAVAGWSMPADPAAPFELSALRPDAEPVLRWIASRPPVEQPLHALALALVEDVALVESADAAMPAHASLLHVCWPSGWDPAAKIGLDFAAIHAPVADAQALRAAALPLSRAMLTQGPFVRHVWSLAATPARSRHPADQASTETAAPGGPWFRCERQVSVPIPAMPLAQAAGGAAVFLIRLHVAPLDEVAGSPERVAMLRDALESMSAATLDYKGLSGWAATWRAWLAERGS